jgi:hypothetical protein
LKGIGLRERKESCAFATWREDALSNYLISRKVAKTQIKIAKPYPSSKKFARTLAFPYHLPVGCSNSTVLALSPKVRNGNYPGEEMNAR